MTLRFATLLRDPVHGDVPLTAEELRVLDTPEMQRLRNVRQLGTAYLVYPGAGHTRFEHSVGTAHLAGRLAEEINAARDREADARLGGFDPQEIRLLRLAALVHDATHLPFGHNIEDQTGLLPRHDRPERFRELLGEGTALGRVLGELGVREAVLSILAPEGVPPEERPPQAWRALLSGTLDADMLDYLARDALFTGLKLHYDPRIFSMFRVERRSGRLFVDLSKRGYLREDLLSEVLRCLETRYYFSERVYYHHAKIALGALVAKAVEIALRAGALTLADIQAETDAGLIARLGRARVDDPAGRRRLRTFVEAFRARRVPKRVAVYPAYANEALEEELIGRFYGAGSAEERQRVEARLGEGIRFAAGREVPVLLYCPAGRMQLKSARLLVRWPGREGLVPLGEMAAEIPRLADLERSYRRMWKFYVLALTEDRSALGALQRLCAREFPGAVNVLQEEDRPPVPAP